MSATNYPDTVTRSLASIDVQRHGARGDAPAYIVARCQVDYTYPDASPATHAVSFASDAGGVFLTMSGMAGVYVDNPDQYGDFLSSPCEWVHRFYSIEN